MYFLDIHVLVTVDPLVFFRYALCRLRLIYLTVDFPIDQKENERSKPNTCFSADFKKESL